MALHPSEPVIQERRIPQARVLRGPHLPRPPSNRSSVKETPLPAPRLRQRERQHAEGSWRALRHTPAATSPDITGPAPAAPRLLCPRAPAAYQSATACHAAPHARRNRTRRFAIANLPRRPIRHPRRGCSEARFSLSRAPAGCRAPPIHPVPRKSRAAQAEWQPQGQTPAPAVVSSASTVSVRPCPRNRPTMPPSRPKPATLRPTWVPQPARGAAAHLLAPKCVR